MKDTKLLIVGIALISALMLVTWTITVIPTAIAAQSGGSGSGGNSANQGIGQSQRSGYGDPNQSGSAEWRPSQTVRSLD